MCILDVKNACVEVEGVCFGVITILILDCLVLLLYSYLAFYAYYSLSLSVSLSLLRFILYDVIAIATCATKLDFSNPHLARSVSSSLPLPL